MLRLGLTLEEGLSHSRGCCRRVVLVLVEEGVVALMTVTTRKVRRTPALTVGVTEAVGASVIVFDHLVYFVLIIRQND